MNITIIIASGTANVHVVNNSCDDNINGNSDADGNQSHADENKLRITKAGNSNQQLANTELVSNPHSNDASSKKNSQIVYKYKMLHICLLFQFITLSFCMRDNVDNVKKSEDEGCGDAEKKVPLIIILEYICLFN